MSIGSEHLSLSLQLFLTFIDPQKRDTQTISVCYRMCVSDSERRAAFPGNGLTLISLSRGL